jgi:hypothetical protein
MSYDSWKCSPPEYLEDEGLLIIESAMKYLKSRADEDCEEQLTGDFEAYVILEDVFEKIQRLYLCRFCSNFTEKRNSWCSSSCYKADMEGY